MRQYKHQNQQIESEADTAHEQLNWRLGGFRDPFKNRVMASKTSIFFREYRSQLSHSRH